MPITTVPKAKSWNVSYAGEYFADVIETFNTDFSVRQSKVCASQRMYPHTDSSTVTGLGLPTAFCYTNADQTYRQWIASDKMYKTANILTTAFALDGTASSPTGLVDPDMINPWVNSAGYEVMIVSSGSDLHKLETVAGPTTTWDNTWWTATLGQTALLTTVDGMTVPHPMCKFGEVLIIGDGNYLHKITYNPGAGTYDVSYQDVTYDNRFYVNWLVVTKKYIYVGLSRKDPSLPSVVSEYDWFNQNTYEIDVSEGSTIGFYWSNKVNVVDYKGQLREYTGMYFRPYASFPPAYKKNRYFTLPHRNGIAVIDKEINILVNTSDPSMYAAGVWQYESEFQRLYHMGSFSQSKTTVVDYGSATVSDVGFLTSYTAPYLFAGLTVYTSATATKSGVFTNLVPAGAPTENRAYLVTGKIPTASIDNIWRNLLLKYSYYDGTTLTGNIIPKYRTTDPIWLPVNTTATWVTDTTFTIASTGVSGVSIGDEVFIVRGQGAGGMAFISNITGTTTKTITLATSIITGASGTFVPYFRNFKAMPLPESATSLTTSRQSQIVDVTGPPQSEWIQFCIEFQGSVQLEDLGVGWQPNQKLEN